MTSRPERAVAVCGLTTVPGIGAATLQLIEEQFGALEHAAAEGGAALLTRVQFRSAETRAYLARDPDLIALGNWAIDAAEAAGARVLLPGDFPALLRSISTPPAVLYVRGELGALQRPRCAVVGSRKAEDAALAVAGWFGRVLARAGVQVVSGGARGIDTAAHEGALDGRGSTVAVLGSGIDIVYPAENRSLFDRIVAEGGAIVSELSPGTHPSKQTFPRRNRTVAGMCSATVVVRAEIGSGALITAKAARQLGREVYAFPGSSGCDALIAAGAEKGARGASTPASILSGTYGIRDLPDEADAPRQPSGGAAGMPSPARPVLSEDELAVWSLLDERTPAHVDEVALRANIPAREALKRLASLELRGLCLQRPGKYFLRAMG